MPFLLLSLPVKLFKAVPDCEERFLDGAAVLSCAKDCASPAGPLRLVGAGPAAWNGSERVIVEAWSRGLAV